MMSVLDLRSWGLPDRYQHSKYLCEGSNVLVESASPGIIFYAMSKRETGLLTPNSQFVSIKIFVFNTRIWAIIVHTSLVYLFVQSFKMEQEEATEGFLMRRNRESSRRVVTGVLLPLPFTP